MDILLLLEADHRRQRALANQIRATALSAEERRPLFDAFCEEVEAHWVAEEQTLYGELLSHSGGQIRAQVEDHDRAAAQLLELRKMDLGSPEWLAAFEILARGMEGHLDTEEAILFPLFRAVVPPERSEMLARRIEPAQRHRSDCLQVPPGNAGSGVTRVHRRRRFPAMRGQSAGRKSQRDPR